MDTRKMLIGEIAVFTAETGMAVTTLGRAAVGDPSLAQRLRDGRDITTGKLDRVRAFMLAHRAEAAKPPKREHPFRPPRSRRSRRVA